MNRLTRVAPLCLLIISLMSSMAVSSQTREGARRRPTTPGQQRPVTVNQQKPTPTPTNPKPTAEWLLAQPNPLNVSAIPSQYSSVSKLIMSATGGNLTATGPDGTRFTLTVPPNAVPNDVKITMLPVIAIENLPFSGGLVAAVQITPDDVGLYKAPTLLIEPPQPIPPREQTSFASFAYHGDGREFHLYPMETDPSKIAFKLVTLGGYGVARGTKAEQETVRARIPTDPGARFSMQMQKVLSLVRERRLLAASSRVSSPADFYGGVPRIVRASFGRIEMPQQGEGESVAAFLKDLLLMQLELFDQKIMPSLRNARPGCTPGEQKQLADILENAFEWERRVALLGGLTSRTDVGWTADEIQAIDASADEYWKRVQAFRDEFFRLLKESFDKFYDCCIKTPNVRYPPELVRVERQAALWFNGNPASLLGQDYMDKIEQCACAAGDGGWQGTVTVSTHRDENSIEYGAGTPPDTWKKRQAYTKFDANITIDGEKARGTMQAEETISSDQKIPVRRSTMQDNYSADYSGDMSGAVSVHTYPDGKYSITFMRPKMIGTFRASGSVSCFGHLHRWEKCEQPVPTSEPWTVGIPYAGSFDGEIDPKKPNEIKANKSWKEGEIQYTFTANLKRCK